MEKKVKLATINPCITCFLCKGYLIDATTITECLHTFCKTCIVKFLKDNTHCPVCDKVIHQSHPKNYISHDRTMQDIVFKLVPNLQNNEKQRQIDFYRKLGLEIPTSLIGESSAAPAPVAVTPPKASEKPPEVKRTKEAESLKPDDQVNVCLECSVTPPKKVHRRFIRCSCNATITHLKKYISLKLFKTMDRYREVEIHCNSELMGKDHTLKFITVTRWRNKNKPLCLQYQLVNDPEKHLP